MSQRAINAIRREVNAIKDKISQSSIPVTKEVSSYYLSTWKTVATPIDRVWVNLAWAPEISTLVAVSHSGTSDSVMTSPDGINWTVRTCPAQEWRGVAWSPQLKLFAAVAGTGTGNRVMTSPDGITWTSRTSAGDYVWRYIIWCEQKGLFVAVANGSGFSNHVMTSPDGINWTARKTPDKYWNVVVFAPELNLFVAAASSLSAGETDTIMTSPDAINWTLVNTPSDGQWHGLTWSPELRLFVAVAYLRANGQRVMTSPDGVNWTMRSTPLDVPWLSVAWSPELHAFAAVNDSETTNGVMTSPDGINWTIRTTDLARMWRRVFWIKEFGSFVAIAYTYATSGVGNLFMMTNPIDDHQQYAVLRGRSAQTIKVPTTIESLNGLTLNRGGGNILGNIALGDQALAANTTGQWNTALGHQTLKLNTVKGWNTAVGLFAMTNYVGDLTDGFTAGNNVAVGASAMRQLTTGRWNTGIGADALRDVTTGIHNTGLGLGAGRGITTGSYNTVIGQFETFQAPMTAALSNAVVIADGLGDVRFYSPSSKNILFGTLTDNGVNKVQVNGSLKADFINLPASTAPTSSADSSGSEGDLKRDAAGNLYLKTATGWLKFTGTTF